MSGHNRYLTSSDQRFVSFLMAWLSTAVWVGGVSAGVVTLDNGVTGDGRLVVEVDDFGSFANGFSPGPDQPDSFDPSADPLEGELGPEAPTFGTAVFLYIDPSNVGNGTHRGVFSGHAAYIDRYNLGNGVTADGPGNLDFVVVEENSTDTLPASTNSVIDVTGPGGVALRVTVAQSVSSMVPGPAGEERALLDQVFRFKNTGNQLREWIIVKHIDEDMPWGGGGTPAFAQDDLVGADFAELDRPQVYAQDRELTTAALVLRTRDNHHPGLPDVVPNSVDFVYYASKQSLRPSRGNPDYPDGDCPEYGFGTDYLAWNNFGIPNCWKNHVPGVGYNIPGISPQLIADSHIGLQVEARISPGSTYEVSFQTIYGFRPEPTTQIPPALEATSIQFDSQTGCGEFLWTLTNINPVVPGEQPLPISEFFIDLEAGDGDLANACFDLEAPSGWTAELCSEDADNNHVLYRFFGGTLLERGDKVVGRLTVRTNGNAETVNPVTGVPVPPLSVVLHAAQLQLDNDKKEFPCDFTFGPEAGGGWSGREVATAFLPVPSLVTWARGVLLMGICAAGLALTLGRASRSPKVIET